MKTVAQTTFDVEEVLAKIDNAEKASLLSGLFFFSHFAFSNSRFVYLLCC